MTAICRCQCGAAFLAHVIAWEPSSSNLRVYALFESSEVEFSKIQSQVALAVARAATKDETQSRERGECYEALLADLQTRSSENAVVLASEDFEHTILAARQAKARIYFREPTHSASKTDLTRWLQFLNLTPDGQN